MKEKDQDQHTKETLINKNRRTLLLILFVSIAPLALAYFSFFTGFGVPDNTVNHGAIINPALNVEALFAQQNQAFYKELIDNKKWHIFIPIERTCNDECQEILFITRQVHIRLGEKSGRIERVAINLAGASGKEFLEQIAAEHPKLHRVNVDNQEWSQWLEQYSASMSWLNKPYYLLVDQEGFAMMRYTADVDGGDLLKDLKRALKHSIDYQ